MALVSSEVVVSFEEVVKRDDKDNIIDTKKVKVTKRIYPCRPQVNERKNWPKFGDVAGMARGTHKKGDFTLNQHPAAFETDDGNVEEELDMVKQIKKISKESMMIKQLRAGK
jgi:hypothetical protein